MLLSAALGPGVPSIVLLETGAEIALRADGSACGDGGVASLGLGDIGAASITGVGSDGAGAEREAVAGMIIACAVA
jgi:hypothetical protein